MAHMCRVEPTSILRRLVHLSNFAACHLLSQVVDHPARLQAATSKGRFFCRNLLRATIWHNLWDIRFSWQHVATSRVGFFCRDVLRATICCCVTPPSACHLNPPPNSNLLRGGLFCRNLLRAYFSTTCK